MPLPIEEDMVEEARFILRQIIENGSMKGVPEFAPLIKSGLLVRAEYDLQAVQTKGKELKHKHIEGEDEYVPHKAVVADMNIVGDTVVDPNCYYILNHRKFIHLLRCSELRSLIANKLDAQAAVILGMFIDDSKYIDKSEVFEISEVMSFSQISSKARDLKILNPYFHVKSTEAVEEHESKQYLFFLQV